MSLKIAKPTGAKVTLAKPTGARVRLRSSWSPADPDAAAYITAVETADGQALEERTKIAIDDFVLGCKSDGIWTAIKASCILAGARTLSGALVPLVGAAPTNFNFVSGDYNRKTGLVGNASTKYLDSNRVNNADPQNSKHVFVNVTASPSGGGRSLLAGDSVSASSLTDLEWNAGTAFHRLNSAAASVVSQPVATITGGHGLSRSSASQIAVRINGQSNVFSQASVAPGSDALFVYRRSSTSFAQYSNARLAFYSIGESLNLTLLDARVSQLINTFAAVIP